MSTVSPAEPRPRSEPSVRGRRREPALPSGRPGAAVIDGSLVLLFLALTFLLGVFPLKDADFYWHLRTGDLIRKTGQIPRVDFYTFTRQGRPGSTCTGSSRSASAGSTSTAACPR